eukprot:391513-Pyramimonas_sp.AAC.1
MGWLGGSMKQRSIVDSLMLPTALRVVDVEAISIVSRAPENRLALASLRGSEVGIDVATERPRGELGNIEVTRDYEEAMLSMLSECLPLVAKVNAASWREAAIVNVED